MEFWSSSITHSFFFSLFLSLSFFFRLNKSSRESISFKYPSVLGRKVRVDPLPRPHKWCQLGLKWTRRRVFAGFGCSKRGLWCCGSPESFYFVSNAGIHERPDDRFSCLQCLGGSSSWTRQEFVRSYSCRDDIDNGVDWWLVFASHVSVDRVDTYDDRSLFWKSFFSLPSFAERGLSNSVCKKLVFRYTRSLGYSWTRTK